MTIQIQRNTRFTATFPIKDKSRNLATVLNGKDWKFTLKELSDKAANNDSALIEQTGTITDASISLDLSVTETNLPLKKYKADFRIYTDETDPINTTMFEIEIVDTVTK